MPEKDGQTLRPLISIRVFFSKLRMWFSNVFLRQVSLKGSPETRPDRRYTKTTHSHERPPFPHQAQQRRLPGTEMGEWGAGEEKARSEKGEGGLRTLALVFITTTRGSPVPTRTPTSNDAGRCSSCPQTVIARR